MTRTCLLLLSLIACGVPQEPPKSLEALAQESVNSFTTAIVSNDPVLLETVMSPTLLASDFAGDRQKELKFFISTQREGLVMTYGETPPKVVEVIDVGYGRYDLKLSSADTYVEGDKLLHMMKVDGKLLFAGAQRNPPPEEHVNQSRQAIILSTNATEYWTWKYKTYVATFFGLTCYQFGIGWSATCNYGIAHSVGAAYGSWSNQSTECRSQNASCKTKLSTGPNWGDGCFAQNTCCWYNIFGDDVWWTADSIANHGYDSHGALCHVNSCDSN